MRTVPASPSNSTVWPVWIVAVARPVPTTAGMPYSRATMAQAVPNRGVHGGDVVGVASLIATTRGLPYAGLAVAAVVVVAATWFFVRRDLRHPDPVFQPRFFRRRAFASANAGIGMSNLAMYTFLLSVPLLLASQGRRRWRVAWC